LTKIDEVRKWLKQHLRVKEFYGTTENAVKIQIYAAITAYCLVVIVQEELKLEMDTFFLIFQMMRRFISKTRRKNGTAYTPDRLFFVHEFGAETKKSYGVNFSLFCFFLKLTEKVVPL